MTEMVQKKIEMKLFKTSLQGSEVTDYAASHAIKIAKAPKDTFFMGEIFVDNQIYGLLGFEKEYWSDESTSTELEYLDRVVLKLYNTSGRNIGIIEERILKELTQSVVSGTLPVFSITLTGSPYVIDIEKESNELVFPLLTNEKKGIFEIFQISKKSLAIGADFTVTRKLAEQKVGFIDSKRGGKVEIDIYDDELAKNTDFIDILALFAGTIQYHDAIAEKIKKTVKAISDGSIILKPSKKALELMLNPRKVKSTKQVEEEKEEKKEKKKRRSGKKKRKIRGAEEEDEPPKKKVLKKDSESEAKSSEKFKELHLNDPVKKASGIGTKLAAQLNEIGINSVEDLLSAGADEIEAALKDESITAAKVKKWQSASQKRVKATFEQDTAEFDESDDYDLLDYEF